VNDSYSLKATIPQLLCPLAQTPIIYCAGANYRQHAKEKNVGKTEKNSARRMAYSRRTVQSPQPAFSVFETGG